MGEPTSQPSGALVNLNAVVDFALTLRLSEADRAELQSVQAELDGLCDRVKTVLGLYEYESIRRRLDTRILQEVASHMPRLPGPTRS